MSEITTIGQLVRKAEQDFISGTGTLMSKYVRTDLYEDINKIYAYLESTHISGKFDSLDREKPFFNVCIASRNIWYRATDIDRKNIKIKPTKSSDIYPAFIATHYLQDWMRRDNFGAFLNNWGLDLAGFNSAVVKFVEKGNELYSSVIPWSRLIVDQINFDSNPKIEILELTAEQLKSRGYDEKEVNSLIEANKIARETTNKQKKDNKNNYFKVYEVHGVFPLSFLTGNEKDTDVAQQMYVLSFQLKKDSADEYEQYVLYKGREEKDPYMLTSLMPATDGSVSLNGAVKNLFEVQWMVNHTAHAIKTQLDISSKLIFQTSDGTFVGQNALNAVENGDILIHQPNQPLTQLSNNSHDITALQSFGSQWKALGNEVNGVSESMMGNTAPSGTAWRQVEALLNENHSLFEQMTENKGLEIERMMRKFIIPHIKKRLNNTKEIVAVLESYDLEKIDAKYLPVEANKRLARKIIDTILNTGNIPLVKQQDKDFHLNEVKKELTEQGTQRFFSPDEFGKVTWSEVFKDIEWDLEIDITGEQTTTKEDMATLATVLQTIVAKQGQPMSPEEKLIFNKILTKTGAVSPLEISGMNTPVMPTAGVDTGIISKQQ